MAATLVDRDLRATAELNIKPQISTSFESSVFKPNKYLDARKEHCDMPNVNIKTANAAVNKLYNTKQST